MVAWSMSFAGLDAAPCSNVQAETHSAICRSASIWTGRHAGRFQDSWRESGRVRTNCLMDRGRRPSTDLQDVDQGACLDAGETAETALCCTFRSRIPCLPAPASGLFSGTSTQRRRTAAARRTAGIAAVAFAPSSRRVVAQQPAATIRRASGPPGRAARRSRCMPSRRSRRVRGRPLRAGRRGRRPARRPNVRSRT